MRRERERLPPEVSPVDGKERETGEVAGREREKERERVGRFEEAMDEGRRRKSWLLVLKEFPSDNRSFATKGVGLN